MKATGYFRNFFQNTPKNWLQRNMVGGSQTQDSTGLVQKKKKCTFCIYVPPKTRCSNCILLTEYCIKTSKHRRYAQSYLRRTTRIHLWESHCILRMSVMQNTEHSDLHKHYIMQLQAQVLTTFLTVHIFSIIFYTISANLWHGSGKCGFLAD